MSEYVIQDITALLRSKQQIKTHEKIKKIVKWYCLEKHDTKELAILFSGVYESLYHDLITKKIKIPKNTLRIIEFFAIFPSELTLKQRKFYNKVMK